MSSTPVSLLMLHAAHQGDMEQVQTLVLEGGANVNFRNDVGEAAVHVATRRGLVALVELLLGLGADANVAQHARCGGQTPLHVAAKSNALAVVAVLLEHHADPNIADAMGKLPLHDAAREGHLSMVKMLLAGGSRPDATDDVGLTPWNYAKRQNHVEIAACLPPTPEVPYAKRAEEAAKRIVWVERRVAPPKK